MFVRKQSPARHFKATSKGTTGRNPVLQEMPSSRSKNKELRRDKRSSRSKSKDGRRPERNCQGSRIVPQEQEDIFGMNSLRQKLTRKRKKPTDNQSVPTTTIDQDVIEQQQQTIRLLTAQLEKEKQKGKQLLKALQSVNSQIEHEKHTLKIESRVK